MLLHRFGGRRRRLGLGSKGKSAARALGEYGATAMLAGNIAGKTGTISQKIANVIKDGDYATAGVWVVIMLVIALVIIMLINYFSGGKNRKQNRW